MPTHSFSKKWIIYYGSHTFPYSLRIKLAPHLTNHKINGVVTSYTFFKISKQKIKEVYLTI